MLNIAFGQSKYYVDNLVENIKRGIRQKLRRGEFPGKAPIGYLNEPRLRTIVVDEKKAPLVQQMFETYASGKYSLPQLRNLVATWGLVSRRGKPISLSKMSDVLSSPFYLGMFRYEGELYEGSHSPIISRKLFERVQEVLAQSCRAHFKRKHLFQFAGLLTCGECGCSITAERQKGTTTTVAPRKKGSVRRNISVKNCLPLSFVRPFKKFPCPTPGRVRCSAKLTNGKRQRLRPRPGSLNNRKKSSRPFRINWTAFSTLIWMG